MKTDKKSLLAAAAAGSGEAGLALVETRHCYGPGFYSRGLWNRLDRGLAGYGVVKDALEAVAARREGVTACPAFGHDPRRTNRKVLAERIAKKPRCCALRLARRVKVQVQGS